MFIRPYHKKQYKELLDGLIGQPVSDVPVRTEEQQRQSEGNYSQYIRTVLSFQLYLHYANS